MAGDAACYVSRGILHRSTLHARLLRGSGFALLLVCAWWTATLQPRPLEAAQRTQITSTRTIATATRPAGMRRMSILPLIQSDTSQAPVSATPTAQPSPTVSPTAAATATPNLTPPAPTPTIVLTLPSVITAPVKLPLVTGKVWKIMPLGDSLTQGGYAQVQHYSYRGPLQNALRAKNIQYDFIGSTNYPAGSLTQNADDHDHEGHVGYTIGPDPQFGNISANLNGYLANQNPDVFLLFIGTNDVSFNATKPRYTAADKLTQLVSRIAVARPNAVILIASLLPRPYALDSDAQQTLADLNGRAAQLGNLSATDQLFFVDLYTQSGVGSSAYYLDDVHMNAAGAQRIADVWTTALTAPRP
jgi:lysophospholipase L1-like esterase